MINMTTMTPAEKAYFETGGNADPYPGEKVETPAETPVEMPEPKKGEAKAEPEPEKPEAEDGEDETVEVADGTNPDGTPRRKMIAFGAYEKQRKAARAKDETISTLQQRLAYLEGLSQGIQPKPQPAPQELSLTPPDKAKEPEKYLAWLEEAAKEALTIKRQTAQQSEQQTQFQQINQVVFEHEQAFINGDQSSGVEAHPDFHDAVKFLQDRHRAELKEAGYDAHEIQQIMTARAQSVALKALQAGKSPAERVYSLAKLNGYKRPAAPKETEAEKIARQAKNQEKAGKSISDLPGGESKGLTVEALANMDPKAFQKLWDSGDAKALIGFNQ